MDIEAAAAETDVAMDLETINIVTVIDTLRLSIRWLWMQR